MLIGIDHVVVAVGDLAQAAADFGSVGLTVTPGGEHTGGATHNALVSFADGSYLELIAVKDPGKAAGHPWFAALGDGDGAVAFALLARDLPAEAARLNDAGLHASEAREGGRTRPDGVAIGWRTVSVAGDVPLPLPFLIDDATPRELRVPGGAATTHALGATGIAGLTIVLPDLAPAAGPFAALLGAGVELDVARFGGVRARTRFALGNQWIDLLEPDESGGERFPREGIARVDLAGGTRDRQVDLPIAATHGLQLRFDG